MRRILWWCGPKIFAPPDREIIDQFLSPDRITSLRRKSIEIFVNLFHGVTNRSTATYRSFHRAAAAFLAISALRLAVRDFALASPPFDAPSFDRAAAAADTAGSITDRKS